MNASNDTRRRGNEPGPSARTVSQNLLFWRRFSGVSLGELAARTGRLGYPLTRTAISRIEHQRQRVSVDALMVIASALDVPPIYLLAPADGGAWTGSAGPQDQGQAFFNWLRGAGPKTVPEPDVPPDVAKRGREAVDGFRLGARLTLERQALDRWAAGWAAARRAVKEH